MIHFASDLVRSFQTITAEDVIGYIVLLATTILGTFLGVSWGSRRSLKTEILLRSNNFQLRTRHVHLGTGAFHKIEWFQADIRMADPTEDQVVWIEAWRPRRGLFRKRQLVSGQYALKISAAGLVEEEGMQPRWAVENSERLILTAYWTDGDFCFYRRSHRRTRIISNRRFSRVVKRISHSGDGGRPDKLIPRLRMQWKYRLHLYLRATLYKLPPGIRTKIQRIRRFLQERF